MQMHSSQTPHDAGRGHVMRRDRFEVDQYVRVQVAETRFAIGKVTAIDDEHDKATVETRNGYEVTLPFSALRRAFLLVLDLNGVLVARGRGSFILRPHVLDFLRFVFSNFVVAVWTSGLQRSSNPIIEHVFGSYRDLLLFTLFRDACVSKATVENPYGTEKNLQTIFDRYPLSFHAVNTIIIDDSPDKCSHPDIALCPIPFNNPVTQSQDEGLVETMATLREVLQLDSGAPLIRAAEARLRRLAEGEGAAAEVEGATSLTAPPGAAASSQQAHTLSSPAAAAAAAAAAADTPAGASSSVSLSTPPTMNAAAATAEEGDMEEVELWKTRLCCDHLQGRCKQGDHCAFSHDPDDGRPCSRKSNCRVHGARWPKTREETEKEVRKRLVREQKQQEYKMELERRQLEQQAYHNHNSSNNRQQQRRQSDILVQLQQATTAAVKEQQQPRQQQQRVDQRVRQPQHRGRHQDVWALPPDDGEEEEDDWASANTGLSHTGDPAYDNMINQQQRQQRQQQQQQRSTQAAATHAPFRVEEQLQHRRREERGGGGGASSSLSSGYRRQLQHHKPDSSSSGGGANSREAPVQSYAHLQQSSSVSGQGSRVSDSLALMFPGATMGTATTTTVAAAPAVLEPFSTRSMAPSPPAPQAPSLHFPVSQSSQTHNVASAVAQGRSFTTFGTQRVTPSPAVATVAAAAPPSSSSSLQSPYFATSSSAAPRQQQQQQQQQTIRISGRQGDSGAVVSQLHALLRGS